MLIRPLPPCVRKKEFLISNIDALAATGVRFTHGFAPPLCCPSRTTLNTGRYLFRNGALTNTSSHIPSATDEPLLARTLRQAGYVTGMAGKWRQMKDTPGEWGFDEWLTDPSGTVREWTPEGKEVRAFDDTH